MNDFILGNKKKCLFPGKKIPLHEKKENDFIFRKNMNDLILNNNNNNNNNMFASIKEYSYS